jgi:hypothetical protein
MEDLFPHSLLVRIVLSNQSPITTNKLHSFFKSQFSYFFFRFFRGPPDPIHIVLTPMNHEQVVMSCLGLCFCMTVSATQAGTLGDTLCLLPSSLSWVWLHIQHILVDTLAQAGLRFIAILSNNNLASGKLVIVFNVTIWMVLDAMAAWRLWMRGVATGVSQS